MNSSEKVVLFSSDLNDLRDIALYVFLTSIVDFSQLGPRELRAVYNNLIFILDKLLVDRFLEVVIELIVLALIVDEVG